MGLRVPNVYSIVGSDGELETYHDPYGEVTDLDVEAAINLETKIINQRKAIDVGYLTIALDLAKFQERKLYLARGYSTFRAWADSPEISIGWRLAHDLIRIVNEAIPILERNNALDALPPISNMRDLLPILADDDAESKFVEAAYQVKELTNREAKDAVRQIRGIERPYDEPQPAIFKASVIRGESFHSVTIHCSDGNDFYKAGTLFIKPEHWPRWASRFGEMFTEIAE